MREAVSGGFSQANAKVNPANYLDFDLTPSISRFLLVTENRGLKDFEKLSQLKWLKCLGLAASLVVFIALALIAWHIYGVAEALVVFGGFTTAVAGVVIGNLTGKRLATVDLMRRTGFDKRLGAGISAFMFLVLPVILMITVKGKTQLVLEHHGLKAYILWALLAGVVFAALPPEKTDT